MLVNSCALQWVVVVNSAERPDDGRWLRDTKNLGNWKKLMNRMYEEPRRG
jgi:hypothetical protein